MSTTVEQLLSHKGRTYHSVAPDTSVHEALVELETHDIGALLVCEGERLFGLFSERDCVRQVSGKARVPAQTRVRDVMSPRTLCVSPSDSIEYCMALMTRARMRHLPVLCEGQIAGVVSMGDVIHAVLREKEHMIASLESYITGSPSARPAAL